jgi:hypothetical protein
MMMMMMKLMMMLPGDVQRHLLVALFLKETSDLVVMLLRDLAEERESRAESREQRAESPEKRAETRIEHVND